jgi:hypothetical protein
MPDLDVVFAWIVAVLVAEYYAIRRTIDRYRIHRALTPAPARFWREHSALSRPERRP